MRQSGVLAAAALHALEHHRERLGEDHARALGFATALSCSPEVILDLARVQTNIVRFQLRRPFADALVRDAREHGLLLQATAPDALRAVTHLDVSAEDVARAADIVRQRLDALARTAAP
jgi:threonine aldolase